MSALIPAGESGTFRVTVEMLGSMSLDSLEQVDRIIRAEAADRGLDLFVEEDPITRDLIVSWRPAAHAALSRRALP